MLNTLNITLARVRVIGICLLLASTGLPVLGQTSVTVHSLAELLSYSDADNHIVTMAPGEYWIDGDRPDAAYITLSGSNSVFDFSSAQMKIDTRNIAGYRDPSGANANFDVMHISGTDIAVNGLSLYGEDVDLATDPSARRYPNRGATYLRISGDNVELNDAHIITAGSNPYGYGDAFGKGAPPSCRDLPPGGGGCAYIGHNKTSGVLLNGWGTNAKIDGLDLDMFTFGHGVFVQGYDDIEIRDSTVTGQLFSSNDVINHPRYQEYGVNAYNQEMFPDILISGSEDGIRYYGDGNSLDWSENLIIDNVTVTNMREAFSLIAARGTVTVNNASAYGNETGFEPGLGTVITDSRADVTNGPLLYYRRDYVDDTDVEIELVGDVPQVGRTWDVAYINGEDHVVTLTSDIDPDLLSDEAYVRVGQRFNDWRHSLGDLDDTSLPANRLVLNNHTGQITVLGTNGDNVTGYSAAGTINTGDNNYYDGLTLVLAGTRMVLDATHTLGNGGTADDGSLEINASIVESGGTLEVSPGTRITDEKLTISGSGVDGNGALYSDGSVSSDTRFGSSNGSDESTVFLDGDSSIGVGVAGNQLLVGRIQGTGNLTKLGPGTLTIGKSSTYDGNLLVAQGHVTARPGVVHRELIVAAGTSLAGIGSNAIGTSDDVYLFGTLDLNGRTDDNDLTQTVGRLSGTGQVVSSNPFSGTAATLIIDGGTGQGEFSGSIVDNISLVKDGSSRQVLSGNNTYAGTTTVNGGILVVQGVHAEGDTYTVNGGMLTGTGAIESDIIVRADGTLSADSGFFYVDDVDFEANSTFQVDIGPSAFDLLFAEAVTLGGNLVVSLDDDFIPLSTGSYTALLAESITGSLENVASSARVATEGGEGSFSVTYDGPLNQMLLSEFKITGDFNENGIVDGSDFTVWRDTLGQTNLAPFSGADGDGDGQITQSDYFVWRDNFGVTATLPTAIPEPNTVVLMLVGLGAMSGRRWGVDQPKERQ